MTKKIIEAAKLLPNGGKSFPVCLISEGESSRGRYPAAFFNEKNAAALSGVLSFPKHPEDYDRPDLRDPLTAVATIGPEVVVKRDPKTGQLGLWGEYIVPKSKPHVAEHLEEFADRLALSVFAECDGYDDPVDGKFVYTDIDPTYPYRSVDLVIAGGRGGKFEKIAESLGFLPDKTSATAEEKEASNMEIEKEIGELNKSVSGLTKIVEGLVTKLDGSAKADAQVEADAAAVEKIVESRFSEYDKAVGLIAEAGLTESQQASLRALAKTGEDVAPHIESAKKILAEAAALSQKLNEDKDGKLIAEAHLGGGDKKTVAFGVAGFGEVR